MVSEQGFAIFQVIWEESTSPGVKNRSRICFKRLRVYSANSSIADHSCSTVAHLWSSKLNWKPQQSWSPTAGGIFGDFFTIFCHSKVGLLLNLVIFPFLAVVFISTVQKFGSLESAHQISSPGRHLRPAIRSSAFQSLCGPHVLIQTPSRGSPGLFFGLWAHLIHIRLLPLLAVGCCLHSSCCLWPLH